MAFDNPTENELERLAAEITVLVEKVNFEYNKYFAGAEKKPPTQLRDRLDKATERARTLQRQCQSNTLNFKVQNAFNKFTAYKALWDKKLAQAEGRKA